MTICNGCTEGQGLGKWCFEAPWCLHNLLDDEDSIPRILGSGSGSTYIY